MPRNIIGLFSCSQKVRCGQSSSSAAKTFLRGEIPEVPCESDPRKCSLCFVRRLRPPLRAEPVAIPSLGKLPPLGEGERTAAGTIPLPAPAVHVLFRPEQEHGLSGEDDVVVPVAGRNGDVNDPLVIEEAALLDP